jgi:putative two-component system response regulator
VKTSKSKVLIVDDVEENRKIFQRQLRRMGHSTILASDGLVALAEAKRRVPDLILLDIAMPNMDGMSVLQTLKSDENFRHIPVIMISGIDEMENVARCIKLGAEDYLVKPPNLTLLKARIFSALEKKHLFDKETTMRKAMEKFNLHLQDRVSKKENELSQAYLDTLNRLVVAAEFKDEETGEHIMRISRYSALLAEKAGLGRNYVQNILYASPLHDVGKIGVPDSILLKKGSLTSEEFDLMKNHTIIGSQILANAKAKIIQVAHQIALTHHEHWNGKGYPQGLVGDRIPLVGRIVAVVDTFDALTSKRPYKDPYPVDVACEIIRNEQAKHFDPAITDIFLENLSAFVAIKEEVSGPESIQVSDFTWSERDQSRQEKIIFKTN